MHNYHLDHLQYLETEAIHVMREVAAEFERPALLFEGEEPIALFGATDGYKKNGRISCNVQIPLKPAP